MSLDGFLPESDEPVGDVHFEVGCFRLVGHGSALSRCGSKVVRGCNRSELHAGVTSLEGFNYSNKVYAKVAKYSCKRPDCPVCYLSWCAYESHIIEERLLLGSKYGKVEHVIVSIPQSDYGLEIKKLRPKVVKVLRKRGVIGGCMIFHALRYRAGFGWYFSPHFHCLAYVDGGVGRCRSCVGGDCGDCDGFYARCKKFYEGFVGDKGRFVNGDGYVVKCEDERKTVSGTAYYQLNHATVDTSVKRFLIVTWFGSLSNGKVKFDRRVFDEVCPICGHKLKELKVRGDVEDLELGEFYDDFLTCDGEVKYEDKHKSRFEVECY